MLEASCPGRYVVTRSGYWIGTEDLSILLCEPDALVLDACTKQLVGLVEVKCPYKNRH